MAEPIASAPERLKLDMEAPELERRLAAILAADVEGYSRLMHGDEEATMATLSARRAIVDELIARHRGRIANTAGDSVLAEFASTLDAVRCAIEIQAALESANEDEPEGRQMRFRIGVNVGDVMVKDDDIFGDGVNVAARLEGLVNGGRFASRGECAIICVIVAAWSSRIWASSLSRTSPTRSGRFACASVRIYLHREFRIMKRLRTQPNRLPRSRSPNCLPTTRSPSSWRFGRASRTAVLPNSNLISSNIRRARSPRLRKRDFRHRGFYPVTHQRRRHPMSPVTHSILRSGTP